MKIKHLVPFKIVPKTYFFSKILSRKVLFWYYFKKIQNFKSNFSYLTICFSQLLKTVVNHYSTNTYKNELSWNLLILFYKNTIFN